MDPKVDHMWPQLGAEETPPEKSLVSDLAPTCDLISKDILRALRVLILMPTLHQVPSAESIPKSPLQERNSSPSTLRLTEMGLAGQSCSPHLSLVS